MKVMKKKLNAVNQLLFKDIITERKMIHIFTIIGALKIALHAIMLLNANNAFPPIM